MLPEKNTVSEQTGWTVWLHPRAWPVDNRTRKFISLPERNYSHETDLGILRRSAEMLLRQQDERGSFYTDAEYRQGDKVDDQLGGASILAYFLSRTGCNEEIVAALERAVRFHLDHLVWKSPSRRYRYSRSVPDREENDNWCGQLWCLWGGTQTLRHGAPFLSGTTAVELRELLAEYWGFLSTFPIRNEQPCHNQRLSYCELGVAYAEAIGDKTITAELIEYYHREVRPLRILDRGHRIFSEFNQWDVHYGGLSWMMLEHLCAATGEPAFAEDAEEMALYFNEQVSAGGYSWGGPRNNECGSDEFPHVFASRAADREWERSSRAQSRLGSLARDGGIKARNFPGPAVRWPLDLYVLKSWRGGRAAYERVRCPDLNSGPAMLPSLS